MEIEESVRKRAEALLRNTKTMANAIGIQLDKLSREEVIATMPVDSRTIQPAGILHGGATVALAETVMSIGGLLNLDNESDTVVGLEINANHIRTVKEGGRVVAIAKPLHIGRRTQVWETKVMDTDDKLISVSRSTLAVIPLP